MEFHPPWVGAQIVVLADSQALVSLVVARSTCVHSEGARCGSVQMLLHSSVTAKARAASATPCIARGSLGIAGGLGDQVSAQLQRL